MLDYKPSGIFLLRNAKKTAVEIPLQGPMSSVDEKFHHVNDDSDYGRTLDGIDQIRAVVFFEAGSVSFYLTPILAVAQVYKKESCSILNID